MKKIECIIRPSKLEEVKSGLFAFGIHGMTVSNVLGCGAQHGRTEIYRGSKYTVDLLPKVKLEIALEDGAVDQVIKLIREKAGTGQIGDGKIFVFPLENAIRIRTGDAGEGAIQSSEE